MIKHKNITVMNWNFFLSEFYFLLLDVKILDFHAYQYLNFTVESQLPLYLHISIGIPV